MEDAKIVNARLERHGAWDPVDIMIQLDGEEKERKLLDFFDDEIIIDPLRMIGMTEKQARDYKRELDIAYLRS